jgi:SOS response regulatory protein OraA/RecX
MDEIYRKAVQLLAARDYSAAELIAKLSARFDADPAPVITRLQQSGALNDRRFAENFIERRAKMSPARLREELIRRGVDASIIDATLRASEENRPSLREVMAATMVDRRLKAPLSSRDAARLARAVSRLGYPEDDIREEIERLHEQ